jgi:hypothetical protein
LLPPLPGSRWSISTPATACAGALNCGVVGMPRRGAADRGAFGLLRQPARLSRLVGWQAEKARWTSSRCRCRRRSGSSRPRRTAFGPQAFTHFAEVTGEIGKAMAADTLYPVPFQLNDVFYDPHSQVEKHFTDSTLSVHIYTNAARPWWRKNPPLPGSLMSRGCARSWRSTRRRRWKTRAGRDGVPQTDQPARLADRAFNHEGRRPICGGMGRAPPRRRFHRGDGLYERLFGRHRPAAETAGGAGHRRPPPRKRHPRRHEAAPVDAEKPRSRRSWSLNSDWLLVLDADEFLCINHPSGTLDGLVADLNAMEASAMVLTWRIFGSSGMRDWSRAAGHRPVHPRRARVLEQGLGHQDHAEVRRRNTCGSGCTGRSSSRSTRTAITPKACFG